MDTNQEPQEKEIASESTHEEYQAPEEKKQQVIQVKTAIGIAAIIILVALVFYYKGLFIAATVNGSPVSRLSVIAALEKSSGKQALDAVITKKLLNGEARKKGITVTSEEVNAEMQKIEDQLKTQGKTLDALLSEQGMTRKDVEEQLSFQKTLEKLLADKIQVTDEEAMKILADNKVVVPKGEEEKYKAQAREQIRGQKLNAAAGVFVEELRAKASIKYFANY